MSDWLTQHFLRPAGLRREFTKIARVEEDIRPGEETKGTTWTLSVERNDNRRFP